MLRFLLPFTPNTVNVGSLFERFDAAVVTGENSASPNMPVKANGNAAAPEQTQAPEQGQTQMQEQESENTAAPVTIAGKPHSPYIYLFFVWAALALLLFVRKITLYQGFIQYVRAGNTEVSDIRLLNLLSDCAEKLHVKTRVELYQNALVASPMMIGFFRPGIVLPACEFKDKELSYIFAHELVHCRQKDMFYKWLVQLAVCVHWFNPFVYLLGKEVNQACELACDEKAISMLDEKARREYGDTLISFLKPENIYKSSLASVTLTEGAEQLKERLGAIMNFRKKTKLMAIISLMAAVLLSIAGFSLGAYAAEPANSYIGTDAAKNAALAHAGVQEKDTLYCNSWLEYNKKRPAYYEVEFVAANIEYEYEIDLYSGAVLKYDTEYHNYSYIQSAGINSAPSNAADIGPNAAKNAALTHAGIQESDTRYCNSWLEYENKRPAYYEVEFVAGNIEYEYDIDIYNGTVLKCDTEYHDYTYSQPAGKNKGSGSNGAPASAADIGQDAAKQAALTHAGLSESQVYHMEIELDYDDGRLEYEVEFKYNQMEYEYDIDAATGNILKYKCDND